VYLQLALVFEVILMIKHLLIIELLNTIIEVLIIEHLLIIELSIKIIEILIIDVGLLINDIGRSIFINYWSVPNIIIIL